MKCHNCGTEIEEGMAFCPNCGVKVDQIPDGKDETVTTDIQTKQTVFCPNCGHKCSAAEVFCEECGARLDGSDTAAQGTDDSGNGTGKKKSHKWLIALPIIVVLAAAAFFGMKYIKKPDGEKNAKVTKVLYYTDSTLKIADLNKTKNMTKEVTDELLDGREKADVRSFSDNSPFTADEKYLYFPKSIDQNGTADLMRVKVSDIGKKEDKSERIASGVNRYRVLKSGKILYSKSDNMYLTDGRKNGGTKIASNITDNMAPFTLSGDETELLWSETKNEKRTIYLMNITSPKNKKTEIVKGMPLSKGTLLYFSDDMKEIHVLNDGELDIYDNQGKKTKIDQDVTLTSSSFGKSPFYEKKERMTIPANFIITTAAREPCFRIRFSFQEKRIPHLLLTAKTAVCFLRSVQSQMRFPVQQPRQRQP